MLSLVSSIPATGGGSVYTDDPIIVKFDKPIIEGFLTGDYFKLFRTNEGITEFYEQVACTISRDGVVNESLVIKPTVTLSASSNYVLLIIGGEEGVRSEDEDYLAENGVVTFLTGTTVRPYTSTTTINTVEVSVNPGTKPDPSSIAGGASASTDLFSATGAATAIGFLSAIPEDRSVGVPVFNRIVLTYNDVVAIAPPKSAFIIKTMDLPVPLDPFAAVTIPISTITTEGQQVILDVTPPTSLDNIEVILNIAPNAVRGTTRTGYDSFGHTIRFTGKLSPLWALPEQIKARLSGFNDNIHCTVSDYELYKLIFEKSIYVRDVLKIVATTEIMALVNKLVICLVLKDLLQNDTAFGSSIKSRTLLSTKIEYYEGNVKNALNDLDECISDVTESLSPNSGRVLIGIRGESYLNRSTKWYEATYR